MSWHTESVDLASEEAMLHGELLLPKGEGPFPGAVLCHGMATDHRAMRPSAQRLTRKGIATLTFDFRGHGKGQSILDENVVKDVIAAIEFLRSHPKVAPERIALVGHSFGALAAIHAAAELDDLGALVSLSNAAEINRRLERLIELPRFGFMLGLGGLRFSISLLWMQIRGYRLRMDIKKTLELWDKLNPLNVIENIGAFPKLFVHCGGDRLVPYEGTLRLYEKARSPKELLVSKGGFHASPLFPGKLRGKWIAWLVSTLTQAKGGSAGFAGEIQIRE